MTPGDSGPENSSASCSCVDVGQRVLQVARVERDLDRVALDRRLDLALVSPTSAAARW
jgi:hypothetical protein